MKPHSKINWRIFAWVLALGLASGVGIFRAQADQWDKKTILTVDQPFQVQERLLQPGQYVFKLLNSNSDRHIVQIYNADQSHLIDTVLAIPNYRLQPTGKSQFVFWETPAGNAKALRAWFYPGDNFGQEFRYPKHLTVLEASASRTEVARASEERSTTTTTQAEAAPPQPAQAETVTQEAHHEETVEAAQATPAQAPPAPAPPVEAPPVPQEPPPASLPKTGTSYPFIGLCGALSLSLYGLLRLKRSA
jgi:hypothetical protein